MSKWDNLRTPTEWKNEVKSMFETGSTKALTQGLMVLYNRQTEDEKENKSTNHSNSVGFNSADAKILTDIAEFYKRKNTLSEAQVSVLRTRLPKYWRQIMTNYKNKQ